MSILSSHFPRQVGPTLAMRWAKPKDDPDFVIRGWISKKVILIVENLIHLEHILRPSLCYLRTLANCWWRCLSGSSGCDRLTENVYVALQEN